MGNKISYAFLFAFMLMATLSVGSTFYVDGLNGNDTNSGTSPDTAWKSIDKVNGAALNPGDWVLFKRGQIFRGNLIPKSGDISGSICYGAYGQGNKPKLLGSVQKNELSDWINQGNNLWSVAEKTVSELATELLPNPDFDIDLAHWSLYNNSSNKASTVPSRTNNAAEYFTAPAGGKLYCNNSGTAISDVQLFTSNLSIEAGVWYKLSFVAKADQPFTIPATAIKLIKNSAPYTSYSLSASKATTIDSVWRKSEFFFKSNTTATDCRIDLFLGTILPVGATFCFDAFSFKKLLGDPGFITTDVGNLIFNNEAFCGTKVWVETDLKTQGQFWYNSANNRLTVYSVENPASFYTTIEIALTTNIIDENNKSYITYENLDLRYGGAHGIGGGNTHHIWIKDLDISFIGGGLLAGHGMGTTRYGNGIEFWCAAHDNIVERCVISQVYDVALTSQGISESGYEARNLYFRNNLIDNCEQSFEFWGRESNSSLHDIYFENNTCLNAGFGWSHTQRPDPNGTHLLFYGFNAKTNNLFIRNNIFYNTANWGAFWYVPNDVYKTTLDYNCWYEESGAIARIGNKLLDYSTEWNTYRAAANQEEHSIVADPLLNSANALQVNSPCINSGKVLTTVTTDFSNESRPKGTAFDMGAFEYLEYSTVNEINLPLFFEVYLDSANREITIIMKSDQNKASLSLYDMAGKAIYRTIINSKKTDLAVPHLPKGIYCVKIATDGYLGTKKFVIE